MNQHKSCSKPVPRIDFWRRQTCKMCTKERAGANNDLKTYQGISAEDTLEEHTTLRLQEDQFQEKQIHGRNKSSSMVANRSRFTMQRAGKQENNKEQCNRSIRKGVSIHRSRDDEECNVRLASPTDRSTNAPKQCLAPAARSHKTERDPQPVTITLITILLLFLTGRIRRPCSASYATLLAPCASLHHTRFSSARTRRGATRLYSCGGWLRRASGRPCRK
jgi:hypothetical protein